MQARGNELIQLHQEATAIAPRLAGAVQAVQEWQARHTDCTQQLQAASAGQADVQAQLDSQTAEVQQLVHLLSAKQKEIDRVSTCDTVADCIQDIGCWGILITCDLFADVQCLLTIRHLPFFACNAF